MTKKLPDLFDPSKKDTELYEGIEYKAYWDGERQARRDLLEKYLIMNLLPVSGRRIIDLGSGYGRLYPCYAGRFEEIVLLDGSLSLLRQARESVPEQAVCVAGDLNHLPFKAAAFDCILVIRVLQHMQDLGRVFGEMRRILGRPGYLIFSYHNKRNAHRILNWLLFRKIANPFSLETKEVSPTLLSHHPTVISNHLSGGGFTSSLYRGAVVFNSIAKRAGKISSRVPSGSRIAPLFGKYKLAPWLVGRAETRGGPDDRPEGSILDSFQCPICRAGLIREAGGYRCQNCSRDYPEISGIIDMRP